MSYKWWLQAIYSSLGYLLELCLHDCHTNVYTKIFALLLMLFLIHDLVRLALISIYPWTIASGLLPLVSTQL